MRRHNGMRPQDIPILLKIVALDHNDWQMTGLANTLFISISEISESLNRSKLAGLISHTKKEINRQNLLEFLVHGIRYVFPLQPGTMVRGIPTAHAHPFMASIFTSEIKYVWPAQNGDDIGLSIEPFYPRQSDAAIQDSALYKLLALVDVLRVGRAREINFAIDELKKIIVHEP